MTTQEGGSMKKYIVVSIVMVLMLVMGGSFVLAQPQDSATEEKPTFYRLIPGVYVNGWPRFTVHYPKDWTERIPLPGQLFLARAPGVTAGSGGGFGIYHFPNPLPLEGYVNIVAPFWSGYAKDVTIVNNKPSQLRDGTPAREVELKMVLNGLPCNWLGVATKKGDLHIHANVGPYKGKIGEDLKAIPYSLQYEPGKDEPVKVPLDVQEFLDRNCNDLLSHDLAKIMANYSDGFLNSGWRKGEMERFWMQRIGPITSVEVGITDFVAEGDKAHLAGFISRNGAKYVLKETSIIKENGEWKWYGNQRDPAPRPRKKSHVSSPRVRRTHEKVHRYISDHSHYIVSREFLRPGLCSRPRKGGETDFLPSRPRHLCERLATFHHHLSEGLG
jgi:hypothetical protein